MFDTLNDLTKKQLIQLYLIPILLIVIVYMNFIKTKDPKVIDIKKTKVLKFQKIDQNQFYKIIQKYAKQYKIDFESESFKNKIFSGSFTSTVTNGLNFLDSLSRIIEIKKYKINYKDKKLHIIIELKQKIYKKDMGIYMDHQNIVNLFDGNISQESNDGIAIFDNYIFKNNAWYGLGEDYGEGKIVKIERNGLYLLKDGKQIFVEMFDE